MPPKRGKGPVDNRGKRKMGESSSSSAAAGTLQPSTIPMMNHFSVQPQQQQVTIPTSNIFSVQPQQQVQQLPCQISSALQFNFNNQPEPEINNLDRFMSRPFTSYTALLTEGLQEQNYVPVNIHRLVERTTKEHSDQVRSMLYDVYRRNWGDLMNAANEEAGRKVKEKDEQLRQARTRIAQLELTVRQLNHSWQIWLSRVRYLERRSALQDVALRARAGDGGSEAQEDSESSSVDPNNSVEPPLNVWGPCRACNNAEAKTMIFPCRHLCLCATCSVSAAVDACPVCQSPKENVYEVILP